MNELIIMVFIMQLHMLGVRVLTEPFVIDNNVTAAIRSKM